MDRILGWHMTENQLNREAGERARLLRTTQTVSEGLLWSVLRARQLCGLKFRRQYGTGAFDARSSRTLEVSSLLHRLLPLLGGFPSLSVSFLWQETSAPSPSWFPSPLFAPRDTLDFGSRCRYRVGISKFVS
jgi:hypothetical protein